MYWVWTTVPVAVSTMPTGEFKVAIGLSAGSTNVMV